MREVPTAAELALLDPDGSFVARLAGDRAAFAALAARLEGGDDDGALAGIELLAHRLGGAAGTFGHAAVGAAALDLEEYVIALRGGGGDRAATTAGLAALMMAIEVSLRLK